MQEKRLDALAVKNVKVFTTQDQILGIPSALFLLGLLCCLCVFVATTWICALLVAVVFYPMMWSMHRDNPKGFYVWFRAGFSNEVYWASGIRDNPLKIVFV